MDPDGGVHANRLRAQKEKEKESTSTISIPLPSEGWTSNLCQLPPFNYSCLYAHLVMGSPTIPKYQISAADTSYRAGALKHIEAGYRLFRDNHVMMVRFNPSLDNYCLFHAYVKPSFKCTGKYSTVVSLKKHSGHVLVVNATVRLELVVVASMLQRYCTISWTIQNLDWMRFLKIKPVQNSHNSGISLKQM